MEKIVLASASPRRAELLRQIGLEFEIVVSGVAEENISEKKSVKLAEHLALSKAKAVAASLDNAIVIAADTVVSVGGEQLGKPINEQDAMRMLRLLSGRSHHVMTGLAVIRKPDALTLSHVETTTVYMRDISDEEILWYIKSSNVYDKAGGYGIQGRAAVFVDKLEGCYFNVVGLPLSALWQLLGSFGIRIWEGAGIDDIQAPDHQGPAPK